jgi:hypothetical protein
MYVDADGDGYLDIVIASNHNRLPGIGVADSDGLGAESTN